MDDKQTDFLSKTVRSYYGANAGFQTPEDDDSYGIEIEAEGLPADMDEDDGFFDIGAKASSWRAVGDGSLRGGIEFVSNGPRSFDVLGDDLDQLTKYLETKKFTPVFSYRTSVHVHCNVQTLSIIEVINLFTLYTIFEKPMIQWGGEERCGNVHCLPVYMAQNVLDRLRAVCYNVDIDDFEKRQREANWANAWRTLTANDFRYASFNWASISRYGTVEFRTHQGTADKERILNWVNIIQSLKVAAQVYHDPAAILNDFSALGAEGLAEKVFGQLAPYFVEYIRPFGSGLWESARLIQFVAYSRKEWPDKIPYKGGKKKVGKMIIDEFGDVNEAIPVPMPVNPVAGRWTEPIFIRPGGIINGLADNPWRAQLNQNDIDRAAAMGAAARRRRDLNLPQLPRDIVEEEEDF